MHRIGADFRCIRNHSVFLRILALLFVITLLCGSFVGCARSNDDSRIDELNAVISNAQKEIEELKKSNSDYNSALEDINEQNQQTQGELETLKGKNEEIQNELNALKESDKAIRDFIENGDMFVLVNGKWVDPYNSNDVINDGGSISFDPETDSLMLKNVDITVNDNFITAYNSLRLELIGRNVVRVQSKKATDIYGIICSDGTESKNLSICGEGSLDIIVETSQATDNAVGISAAKCFFGSDISVKVGNCAKRTAAIECDKAELVGAMLSVTSGEAQKSVGLYVNGCLDAYDSSVFALAKDSSELSEAISVRENITVNDSFVEAVAMCKSSSEVYDVRCLGMIQLFGNSSLAANTVESLNGIWNNNGFPNESKEKIKIYIDQGHNPTFSHNSGAVGNGFYEQDITYCVGHLLAWLLVKDGRFDVRLSRPTDDTVLGSDNNTSLQARVSDAKLFGADYFITIHANAYDDANVSGAEIYIPDNGGAYNDFARAILTGLVDATGLRDRGVKTNSFYVIENAEVPAVLVELGFITNSADAKLMGEQPELFANGMYNGIFNYFNIANN